MRDWRSQLAFWLLSTLLEFVLTAQFEVAVLPRDNFCICSVTGKVCDRKSDNIGLAHT